MAQIWYCLISRLGAPGHATPEHEYRKNNNDQTLHPNALQRVRLQSFVDFGCLAPFVLPGWNLTRTRRLESEVWSLGV